MEKNDKFVIRGLRNVAAVETLISYVNPIGKLYYSGYNIDDLVGRVCYEEIIYLLLNNELPDSNQLTDLSHTIIQEMKIPQAIIERLKQASQNIHPMDILQTEISHLGEYDSERKDRTIIANKKKAIRLIAKLPLIVAYIYRFREKGVILKVNKECSFTENFLRIFLGRELDKTEKEVIDSYMVLHADHGLNASTFAARVTASTQSDIYSAVTAAVGTLKGRLHGGASERVMRMLHQINSVEEVEEYIEGMLDNKKRIMGFGHRVYKREDPRSKHLRERAEFLCEREKREDLCRKAYEIEEIVKKKKGIFPNVDFYAALVLNALGIPQEYFPAFFASSRVSGWVSHILEQYTNNVLIRPTSLYIGDFERKFKAKKERCKS